MALFDWIFLGDEVERGRDLDQRLRNLNDSKVEAGTMTNGQRDLANDNYLKESPEIHAQQIAADFMGGLDEGFQNVTGTIRTVVNAPVKFLWNSIPGWVWVAALAWVVWQLGWFPAIRRMLSAR